MLVKDLIGKVGNFDAYIEEEGTNKSYYHDYAEVVIYSIKEIDGEQIKREIWSSDGVKFGNTMSHPHGQICIGTDIFNEEAGCQSGSKSLDNIKNLEVVNFDFECVLDNSINETSFGNQYRQKTCVLKINVKK